MKLLHPFCYEFKHTGGVWLTTVLMYITPLVTPQQIFSYFNILLTGIKHVHIRGVNVLVLKNPTAFNFSLQKFYDRKYQYWFWSLSCVQEEITIHKHIQIK